MERIFISYKRVNKDQVFKLIERIEKTLEVECWYDKKGIESSSQFEYVICKAIDNAEVVLFMHSKAHLGIDFENDWTVKELNYALRTKKRVILVHIDNAPLENIFLMEFSTRNNIDSQDPEQWERLMHDLRRWLNLAPSDSVIQGETEYKEGDKPTHGMKKTLGRVVDMGTKLNFRKTKLNLENLYIKGKEIKEKGEEYLAEVAESYTGLMLNKAMHVRSTSWDANTNWVPEWTRIIERLFGGFKSQQSRTMQMHNLNWALCLNTVMELTKTYR